MLIISNNILKLFRQPRFIREYPVQNLQKTSSYRDMVGIFSFFKKICQSLKTYLSLKSIQERHSTQYTFSFSRKERCRYISFIVTYTI
jgi:hypothetical protein